ncbi:unnamed protein product [Tuber melanosporum]|uniref:(Perigord truffle) hypothetical protein n=1 Tax=Tuber melanosporum (strain Mel28) TaxID=656061 RepID=D5G9B5_TUBMM|nr:uncharacterized protein GSTUM_00003297001 [Tuber melanosporum]CAZ81108.1 unnamed protein product [Tuber melanosporum]
MTLHCSSLPAIPTTRLTPRTFFAICTTMEPIAAAAAETTMVLSEKEEAAPTLSRPKYAVSAVPPMAMKSAGLVFGGIFTSCQSLGESVSTRTYSLQPKAPRTRSPFLCSGWELSITSPIAVALITSPSLTG